MPLSAADAQAVALTLQLAAVSTPIALAIGLPLAWWLSRSRARWRGAVAAFVALPLVLPPTVLGFYLLLWFGPNGWGGEVVRWLGARPLPFRFEGLVLASVLCNLPFVVQPLQAAFDALGEAWLEAAATLRAGPWDRFVTIALPLAWPGLLAATVLAFAHTIGEFGIVLMIGGNIPGQTQVLSIAIYSHVEGLRYAQAHTLSALLVVFAFVVLLLLQWLGRRTPLRPVGA